MSHFIMYYIYIYDFNRKAILPIEIEIAGHTENESKDERYTFDDIKEKIPMFIAAKDKLFGSVSQNIGTAQKRYTQDYNRRRTITEVCNSILNAVVIHSSTCMQFLEI
jgi:hypothetical protein